MTDNVNWGSQQGYTSYVTTSASSGFGFGGTYQAVDWATYYQSSQIQQQWYSQEYRMQPVTAEAQRILDGWDPDENKESA